MSFEGYIVRRAGKGTYAALPVDSTPEALVVDDEPLIREVLVRARIAHNWRASAVQSGEEALARLEEQKFDLIFLDFFMAGMNGAQTFQEIRCIDESAQAVIITGIPDSQMMAEALKTGPFAIMQKPFDVDHLRSVLDQRDPRGNPQSGI